jgi:hypothetical protein
MQEPRLLPAGTRAAAPALPDLTPSPDLRGLLVGERPNGTRMRTEGAAMITGEAISSSQAVSHTTGAIRTDVHWCCYGGINALSPSVPRQWRPTFAMRGTRLEVRRPRRRNSTSPPAAGCESTPLPRGADCPDQTLALPGKSCSTATGLERTIRTGRPTLQERCFSPCPNRRSQNCSSTTHRRCCGGRRQAGCQDLTGDNDRHRRRLRGGKVHW